MQVHINSTGDMKACCVSNIFLGNIKNSTVESLFDSAAFQELRAKFIRDEGDSRCKNCYLKEAAGNESLRQETLRKYEDLIEEVIENPRPLYFDIRFSNVCNLKCRTCWHGNSSKWFEDARKLNRALGDKALIKAFETDQELENQLGNYIEQAEEFYFAGGEPLLMEEHLYVLERLIEKENFECLLRYNTNLTTLHQFNHDLVEKWKNFKRIEVLASIDGLGEKGEIIRNGIDLELFQENFKRLKALPNMHIQIAPTLSLLNADLLPELHQFFVNQGLIEVDDVHFNVLHQPFFYNVKALPQKQKEKVQSLFEKHIKWIEKKNGNPKDWISAISYMNQDDWSHRFPKAQQETEKLNKLRDERFLMKN